MTGQSILSFWHVNAEDESIIAAKSNSNFESYILQVRVFHFFFCDIAVHCPGKVIETKNLSKKGYLIRWKKLNEAFQNRIRGNKLQFWRQKYTERNLVELKEATSSTSSFRETFESSDVGKYRNDLIVQAYCLHKVLQVCGTYPQGY